MEFIYHPAESHRLGDYLKSNLNKPWTHFRAAIAFVKRSGTRHIFDQLSRFAQNSQVEIIVGIDHQGTSAEGLQDLHKAVEPDGKIIVFHNRLPYTFHPKIYLFKSLDTADVLIGSGNLTEGGLFTNYEAGFRLDLNLGDSNQNEIFQSIENTLDKWADTSSGTAHILDHDLLNHLLSLGFVTPEANSTSETGDVPASNGKYPLNKKLSEHQDSPFDAIAVPRAPYFPKMDPSVTIVPQGNDQNSPGQVPVSSLTTMGTNNFVMTLQRTDVGVGQMTSGTSRRSPEIFIPLTARNDAPDFWYWPTGFTLDSNLPGKHDRTGVFMRLGTNIISVNMMTWPAKHDFRLRSEALRSAGNIGDILHLERVDPILGFEYFVEVIPKGTGLYSSYHALCGQSVRNSKKTYGYY